jgi:hypothetical protein
MKILDVMRKIALKNAINYLPEYIMYQEEKYVLRLVKVGDVPDKGYRLSYQKISDEILFFGNDESEIDEVLFAKQDIFITPETTVDVAIQYMTRNLTRAGIFCAN